MREGDIVLSGCVCCIDMGWDGIGMIVLLFCGLVLRAVYRGFVRLSTTWEWHCISLVIDVRYLGMWSVFIWILEDTPIRLQEQIPKS